MVLPIFLVSHLCWHVPEVDVRVVLLVDGDEPGVAGSNVVQGTIADLGSLPGIVQPIGLDVRGQQQGYTNIISQGLPRGHHGQADQSQS